MKEEIIYYYECDYDSNSQTIKDEILYNRGIYRIGFHPIDIKWSSINEMLQDGWSIKSIKPLPTEEDNILKKYEITFFR